MSDTDNKYTMTYREYLLSEMYELIRDMSGIFSRIKDGLLDRIGYSHTELLKDQIEDDFEKLERVYNKYVWMYEIDTNQCRIDATIKELRIKVNELKSD